MRMSKRILMSWYVADVARRFLIISSLCSLVVLEEYAMDKSMPSSASMASSEQATEEGQPVGVAAEDAGDVVTSAEDMALVQALRAGDEAAFMLLVERYNGALLRLARLYVHDRAVAEEVVQDTWLGVLNGIDRFEPRASLKTWIFRILMN